MPPPPLSLASPRVIAAAGPSAHAAAPIPQSSLSASSVYPPQPPAVSSSVGRSRTSRACRLAALSHNHSARDYLPFLAGRRQLPRTIGGGCSGLASRPSLLRAPPDPTDAADRTAPTRAVRTMASASPPPAAVAASAATGIPSLAQLQALLAEGPPPSVKAGERLAHARERLFGYEAKGEEDPGVVVLYRDNSAWCPYCERVWLQLEEKQVPYRVEKINMRCYGPKPTWFMRMVPSGLLPVVKIKGKVVTESMDIMLLIERAFPNHKALLPSDPDRLRAVDSLLRQERQLAGAWMQWARTPEGRGGGGGPAAWFGGGGGGGMRGAFEATVDRIEGELERFGGPYFLGKEFSLVDAVYAPFLERTAASTAYWKGLRVRDALRWPRLALWFDAMDSRPTYAAIKSDDFTICHTLEPQIGPASRSAEGEAYRALVDGGVVEGGRSSWDLPLGPEETAWGRDDGTGANGAREEAAASLIGNHDAIVKFTLRSLAEAGGKSGAQSRMLPSTTSPTSHALNPSLASEEDAENVSTALRVVAHALLEGTDAAAAALVTDASAAGGGQSQLQLPLQVPADGSWDKADARGRVATAVAYLRDRIGVPRDLTYPAARQLRAHLQWLVRSLGSSL